MLVQLNTIPLGGDTHLSDEIAEVLRVIDRAGLPYQLTPTGTCIEGEWDEVMELVRQCHELLRRTSPHVITSIYIEDQEGAHNQLADNVSSVEEKVGKTLRRDHTQQQGG